MRFAGRLICIFTWTQILAIKSPRSFVISGVREINLPKELPMASKDFASLYSKGTLGSLTQMGIVERDSDRGSKPHC
jgi:hypothetical protein